MSGEPAPLFRQWLRRQPQPHRLRLDGDEKRVIKVTSHASRWAEAEKTVLSYNPQMVEALSGSGEVIRAINLREPEEERETPQKENWPDNEQAQLGMVITASNDRAVSRHVEITRIAVDGFKDLYKEALGRLDDAYQRIARLEAALQAEYAKQETRTGGLPTDENELVQMLGEALPGLIPKLLELPGILAAKTKPNGSAKESKE